MDSEYLVCPYCGSEVTGEFLSDYVTATFMERIRRDLPEEVFLNEVLLYRCINTRCNWWASEQIEMSDLPECNYFDIKLGQLIEFNIESKNIPIKAARQEIKKTPRLAHLAHYDTFEKIIADCLRDKFPRSIVTHVGKSGDGGIDIYCIFDNEPCLVQVKRRQNRSISEGPKVIRELNGVLLREGVYHGIVYTLAKKFTKAAYKETTIRMDVSKPVKIELISYKGVIDLIKSTTLFNNQPWMNYLVRKPSCVTIQGSYNTGLDEPL